MHGGREKCQRGGGHDEGVWWGVEAGSTDVWTELQGDRLQQGRGVVVCEVEGTPLLSVFSDRGSRSLMRARAATVTQICSCRAERRGTDPMPLDLAMTRSERRVSVNGTDVGEGCQAGALDGTVRKRGMTGEVYTPVRRVSALASALQNGPEGLKIGTGAATRKIVSPALAGVAARRRP